MGSMVAQAGGCVEPSHVRLHLARGGADTEPGMDETFSFRAPPLPLRRRIDLRVVRRVVVASVILTSIVVFSRWVIDSERRSEARAAQRTTDEAMIGMMQGAPVETTDVEAQVTIDAPARADARTALETAREAMHGKGSIMDAGPGQLSAIERSLTFTDGPSQAPGIVSVAIAGERWAAAVQGDSGTCYWVALGPRGAEFGSGDLCTGIAALSANDPGWS
jgi:hypothetical protein